MKLNILDRLVLLQILPPEGNFVTLKIVRDLAHNLSLSEKEIADWEVRIDATEVHWNPEANVEKEINIGPQATKIIVDALQRLNAESRLRPEHLDTYEKFIEE